MSKRKSAIGIFMIILAFSMASVTACKEKQEDNSGLPAKETTADTEESQEKEEEDEKEPENQEDSQPEEEVKEPEEDKEKKEDVPIYSINDESLESEQTYVPIEEVTPESVVQAVVDSFAEHSLEIGIDSVAMEGDTVIVSFLYGKAPLTSVGSTVEETILNSIADSLLDNIEECKNVIFRAEGEAYESGHYAFGVDEVYAKD